MEENMKLRLLVGIVGMLMLANIANAAPFAYVLNRGSSQVTAGTVTVIDVANPGTTVVSTITGLGGRPYSIAISPKGGRIYVANQGTAALNDQSLMILDADTMSVIAAATKPLSFIPGGMVLNAAETRLYVADQTTHKVHVYDLNGNDMAEIGAFDVSDSGTPTTPEGIVLDEANKRLYVAKSLTDKVAVFDTTLIEEGIASSDNRAFVGDVLLPTGHPQGLALAKGKIFAACSSGYVAIFPVANPSSVTQVVSGSGSYGITASADGNRVYVANAGVAMSTLEDRVTVINANDNLVLQHIRNGTLTSSACSVAESSDPAAARYYITNVPAIVNTATPSDVFVVPVGGSAATPVTAGVNPCSLGNFMGPVLPYALTTSITGGTGTISPAMTLGAAANTVLVADGGYKTFKLTPTGASNSVLSVLVDGVSFGSPETFTVGPVTKNMTVAVAFHNASNKYLLTANVAGDGYCTVTSTPVGINIVSPANTGSAEFVAGSVAVKASAAAGSLFAGWTPAQCDLGLSTTTSANDTCNVSISTFAKTITATCNPAPSISDFKCDGVYWDDIAASIAGGYSNPLTIQATTTPTKSSAPIDVNAPGKTIKFEGGWDFLTGSRNATPMSTLAVGSFTVTAGTVEMDAITIQ
jgi:DNA-binding beta-propeller fold protein YncE